MKYTPRSSFPSSIFANYRRIDNYDPDTFNPGLSRHIGSDRVKLEWDAHTRIGYVRASECRRVFYVEMPRFVCVKLEREFEVYPDEITIIVWWPPHSPHSGVNQGNRRKVLQG